MRKQRYEVSYYYHYYCCCYWVVYTHICTRIVFGHMYVYYAQVCACGSQKKSLISWSACIFHLREILCLNLKLHQQSASQTILCLPFTVLWLQVLHHRVQIFFFCECSDVNSCPHTRTAISLAELFPHPQSQWVFSASSVSELLLHFGLPQSFSDFCLVLWPGLGFVPLGSGVALGWPCLSVVDQYAHLAYRDDVFQSSSHGLTELLKW